MGTVIKVKHVDDINFRDGSHRQGSEEVPRNAIPHEKELLVNIDCPICIIINYIREVARLSESSEFDLCDETICQLRNIHSFVPDTPGLEVLQPNATYLILTYERDSSGQIVNMVPITSKKSSKGVSEILSKIRRASKKQLSGSLK
ncbi:uncharacterized protein CXorf65 homolog isoform X2 [Orussus abietinus]|uniref:uncharacterized protein CXorf65 homolog isoform X2 n=1 Tax=Orussus abietinus TaxID=222816 RepID=UPI000C715A74|nr:uncharacterized protein CXorf65 homolog isoform X2 [Orussus abietinus]